MDRLFGIRTDLLALSVAAALVAVLAALLVLAWRRPLLVRLGLRAVPRRPLRTALIIAGLTTSTAVIATAIGTGETMAGTIRAMVAGGIGPVDEIIVAPGTGTRAPSISDPRAVLAGSDLAAGGFFPQAQYDRLVESVRTDAQIAVLMPAIQAQATAVDPASGRARTGVNVVGLAPIGSILDTFTAEDGARIGVADLQPGEALVNAEAARLLEIAPGADLQLFVTTARVSELGSRTVNANTPGVGESTGEERDAVMRVRAVIQDGGLAGIQPAVLAPLGAVQELLQKPGQINQILVSNRGGGDSVRYSESVTGRLRLALIDRALAQEIARALSTEAGQSQVRALEARVRPDVREHIQRLRQVARSGQVTPELAYYLAEPALTTQYRWVLNTVANDPSLRGQGDVVARVAPLTVLEVKSRAQSAANEYGSAVTTVFLILGLFSIAASLLLVFLIFVMLAAERRTEMGLTRAVGAQRQHLVAAFAVEGLAYDLAASLVGLLLGVGVGAVVIRLLQDVLTRYDVTIRGQMSWGGVLLAFCLGALVTFATVLAAAWKVSRVNVIAAIHGLAEPETRRTQREGRWGWASGTLGTVLRAAPLILLVVGGFGLLVTATTRGPQRAAGAALLVLGVAFALRAVLISLGTRRPVVDRLIASTAGPAIALLFAFSPAEPRWVRSDAVIRSGTVGFVLAGVAMALALVWAAGRNLDLLLAPVRVLAKPFGALAPATRMAVAYPLTHPFRTGLTAAMFALVFLTMVAATALLRSTEVAYVSRDGGAGFDIRAQFTTPPEDFSAGLAASGAVRPDDFSAVGAQALSQVETLWPGEKAALWKPMEVRAADAGLLSASSGEMMARATGYDTDESIWRAVRDDPGTAIVSRRELASMPELQVALARGGGTVARFEPLIVWLRDPRGGVARKLTVIGVTADGSIVPSGLLTSREALAGSPAGTTPAGEFFLRTREDVSFRQAATGVALTFPNNGVRARVLGDEERTAHAVRSLLDTLVRGFLGMGLASGIAALGVIGMRSVAERRQQIGMLRALGFSRRMVQAAFLLEGSVVAILGITVGAVVGLVLARNVVFFLARDFRELRLIVPWLQVFAIAGAAYGAALFSALIVAWQAGRISPAEALRYE